MGFDNLTTMYKVFFSLFQIYLDFTLFLLVFERWYLLNLVPFERRMRAKYRRMGGEVWGREREREREREAE